MGELCCFWFSACRQDYVEIGCRKGAEAEEEELVGRNRQRVHEPGRSMLRPSGNNGVGALDYQRARMRYLSTEVPLEGTGTLN
jgi:hypothetical protein